MSLPFFRNLIHLFGWGFLF